MFSETVIEQQKSPPKNIRPLRTTFRRFFHITIKIIIDFYQKKLYNRGEVYAHFLLHTQIIKK